MLESEQQAAEERRALRSQWPVRVAPVAELEREDEDLSAVTAVAERFAIMWQIAQDVWTFRGEPVSEPQLSRHPGRLIRRED